MVYSFKNVICFILFILHIVIICCFARKIIPLFRHKQKPAICRRRNNFCFFGIIQLIFYDCFCVSCFSFENSRIARRENIIFFGFVLLFFFFEFLSFSRTRVCTALCLIFVVGIFGVLIDLIGSGVEFYLL